MNHNELPPLPNKNDGISLDEDTIIAVEELEAIMHEIFDLGCKAKKIVFEHFPAEMGSAEAYDIFNFGSSANPFDKTFEKLVTDLKDTYFADYRGHDYGED